MLFKSIHYELKRKSGSIVHTNEEKVWTIKKKVNSLFIKYIMDFN
jgi:hypothetical protein